VHLTTPHSQPAARLQSPTAHARCFALLPHPMLRLLCAAVARSLVERMAARLVLFAVRHASLLRPLPQAGKLQLAKVGWPRLVAWKFGSMCPVEGFLNVVEGCSAEVADCLSSFMFLAPWPALCLSGAAALCTQGVSPASLSNPVNRTPHTAPCRT